MQKPTQTKSVQGFAPFDGLGMGLGFTVALTLIGTIRELLGCRQPGRLSIFGIRISDCNLCQHCAFLVIALIIAALNAFHIKNNSTDLVSGCDGC